MEDYPTTLAEWEARFGTEQACRDYLRKLRWPEGFVCPRCQGNVGMDDQAQLAGLCWLPIPSVADGRYDLPGYAQTAGPVVPGHLVGHRAKERSQCVGAATDSGLEQLRHR